MGPNRGGRSKYGETFAETIGREIREALGPDVKFALEEDPQPVYIAQYGPFGPPFYPEPRKQTLSHNFLVEIESTISTTGGEAIKFDWFKPNELPESIWPGQDIIIGKVLERGGLRGGVRPSDVQRLRREK